VDGKGLGGNLRHSSGVLLGKFLVQGSGLGRDVRVVNALRAKGVPLIHGAVSSILAVLFIAASGTPFLRWAA
jgi:hypothetical protein